MPGAKPVGDGPASRNRVGSGNAGQGYSFEEPTTREEATKNRNREGDKVALANQHTFAMVFIIKLQH
jgi:hypothetical protein